MGTQLAGAESLQGTYPFNLERSVKAFRLNGFLHTLIEPNARTAFLADEEASYERANLSPTERDLLRRRDWRGLIHYGVIFFMLEKLGAVIGVSNLHIYAAMPQAQPALRCSVHSCIGKSSMNIFTGASSVLPLTVKKMHRCSELPPSRAWGHSLHQRW